MPDHDRKRLPKIPMMLGDEQIASFMEFLVSTDFKTVSCPIVKTHPDFTNDAGLIMRAAISFFTMPAIEWETKAQQLIDESYDRGHADGRAAAATHIHVPHGSSLAKEGDIVVVRPGDLADWKPTDFDIKP